VPLYTLHREQILPGTPDRVFPFFADAGNLEAITPPSLRFAIVTPRPIEMRVGALIEYRLRMRGLPISWLTRIEEWEPGVRFVDMQLRGPYALWHHTHTFEPAGTTGTLMRDTVRYALPGGPLAAIPHALFVRSELDRIFSFRAQKVPELLPAAS
jgi:ligand-binding SRPBCC domain-containing protein